VVDSTVVGSMVVGSTVVGSVVGSVGDSTAVEYLLAQASGTDLLTGILMDTTGIAGGNRWKY